MGMDVSLGQLGRQLRGRGYKARLSNWRDEIWDRRLGVRTFGALAAIGTEQDPHWQVHYEPARYRDLFKMLKHVDINNQDVFVDFGSGLGRGVFAARKLGVKRAIGVEINTDLFARSNENAKNSNIGGHGIELFCMPAQEFSDHEVTIIYLFNPFGKGTLGEVVENLRESLRLHPRRVRIVYFNPLFDQTLHDAGFLKLTAHWPRNTELNQGYCRYDVSFWETLPDVAGANRA